MIFLAEKRIIRGEKDLSIPLAEGAVVLSYAGWSGVVTFVFFIDNESVNDVTSAEDSLEGKLLVVGEDVLESGPPCVRIMALHYVTTVRKHLPLEDFSERSVTKVSLSTTAINSTSIIIKQETIKDLHLHNLHFRAILYLIVTMLYHNFVFYSHM